jgi:hypothetical protein
VLSSLSSLKCPVHTLISQVPRAHSSSKCPVSTLRTHLQCALCTHSQRALRTNVPCALIHNVPCALIHNVPCALIHNVPCAPTCPVHHRALRTTVPCAPPCPAHHRALRTNVPCALISVLIAHLLCLTHFSLKPNALQDTPSYFPYSTLSGPASLAAYFVAKYSLLSAPILIPARYTRPFQARQQLYLAPI